MRPLTRGPCNRFSTLQPFAEQTNTRSRLRSGVPGLVERAKRHYTIDGCQRLSQYWIPSTRGTNADAQQDEAHVLLSKAGFIQQAYSGVFQLLPLGLRVQEKIEDLIDHHMRSLGASKLSLSSLSSEGLWRRSGRLTGNTSELLKVRTRAKDAFLLSPTHEEEITKLVASTVSAPKDLPLRLYQITRKYRDERRPRQGLLRTREFVMKDLYTFDGSEEAAVKTYNSAKKAYTALFEALRLPFLVAEADTGNMGGSLSHEFHFPSPAGEDNVFSCESCSYVANEELAHAYRPKDHSRVGAPLNQWIGLERDGRTLIVVHYRAPSGETNSEGDVNVHALKKVVPEIDAGLERPLEKWLRNLSSTVEESPAGQDEDHPPFRVLPVYDASSIPSAPISSPTLSFQPQLDELTRQAKTLDNENFKVEIEDPPPSSSVDLLRVRPGDHCPKCHKGTLKSIQAIELGHTFHLGTRYSEPLEARMNLPGGRAPTPLIMGCHGIGISRMIGAIAAILKDDVGLNWPRICAPFEVVIVAGSKVEQSDLVATYDKLRNDEKEIDVAIDDRDGTLIQKLKDADLIGYPVIIALGRDWATEKKCEVQCRRLGVKTIVPLDELYVTVNQLLSDL